MSYDWGELFDWWIVKECSGAVGLSYDWGELFDWWIDKELTMVRNKMLRDCDWVRTHLMLKEIKILSQSRP